MAHFVRHALAFRLNKGCGQVKTGLLNKCIHNRALGLILAACSHLATQVLLNVLAQLCKTSITNTKGLGKFIIEYGKFGLTCLVKGYREFRGFAGKIRCMVVLGELNGEGLCVACSHCTHGLVKICKHASVTNNKLEALGLAPFKDFAIQPAFKINENLVVNLRCTVSLCVDNALLLQRLHGLVEVGLGHLADGAHHRKT